MHVFTRTVSGWVPQAVLTNPTGEQAEFFAMSGAAVSGYTVAVSASNYDGDGTTRGVVYVFTRTGSTWDLTATLTSPAPADGARFGQALDLDGDTLVVGEGPPGKARRIHTYQRAGSTWQLAGTIMQPGPNPGLGGCGSARSRSPGRRWRSGSTGRCPPRPCVVGCTCTPGPGPSGSCWSPCRDQANDYFGQRFDLTENTLVVGAERPSGVAGRAYVYHRQGDTWQVARTITPPLPSGMDKFGTRVACSDRVVVVTTGTGAAYAYRR